MKYAIEKDSGVMIYMPSLMNIGSDIQKLIGCIHRHADSMEVS